MLNKLEKIGVFRIVFGLWLLYKILDFGIFGGEITNHTLFTCILGIGAWILIEIRERK